MKKITLFLLFAVGSITASFGQFTEGFESGIPANWTVINNGDTNGWEQFTDDLWVIEGTASATLTYSDTDAHDDYLITPGITVVAGVNDRFSFWAQSYDPDYPEQFDLLISTTDTNAASFTTVVATVAPGNDGDYTAYEYNLSAYAGQTIYIAMHSTTFNQWRISVDHVVSDALPATVPDCATLTAPTDAATGVDYTAGIDLAWDAPAAGEIPTSYDVYLDTNAAPTTLLGNQTDLTRTVDGLLPSTTYYWKVIAKNATGGATGCQVFSFTTMANPFAPYCGPIAFANNVEPITLVNFAGINNTTDATVNGTPDHEDFTSITGNVVAGNAYTITLKGNTDGTFYTNRFMVFIDWNQDGDFADTSEAYTITQTITGSTGTDTVQATQSLDVPGTALTGNTRMRVKKIYGTDDYTDPCLGAGFGQVEEYTIHVAAQTTDTPDYANLQWPPTASFTVGGNVTVYGQVYKAGLTDVAPNIVGQAPGISAWVGISTTDTNPNTWTNWTPSTWNSAHNNDNNDEYQATIGATLAPGTYYYATRFQLNGGPYVYGGIDPVTVNNPGGFWNGTVYKSGVLTVNPLINDECSGAIALTPGGVFATNAITTTNVGATTDTLVPVCQTTVAHNVWFSVVVPASGSVTVETQTTGSGFIDSAVVAYTGTCGSLTAIGCDDDGGPTGPNNLMSILSVSGQTPGSTIYFSVFRYASGTGVDGTFMISAYDASLANDSFNDANFSYYPNPVKNNLNLSYDKEISNVVVFNLLGQQVGSNVVNANTAQIDMSNLAKGAYMVKVTSENQVKTIKVIKE